MVLTFLGFQKALQNRDWYKQTTAHLLLNYERVGGWENFEIRRDTLAYQPITENNLNNWDAAIYNCLRLHGYKKGHNCYDDFKAAFFPGFPLFWKFTGLGFTGISLLNFAVYGFGLALLLALFSWPFKLKAALFLLLLSSPNVIIYGIPYSESLFFAAGALATYGWINKKPWLFYLALYLLFVTRVAGIIFLLAIAVVTMVALLQAKGHRKFPHYKTFLGVLLTYALALGTYLFSAYADTGSFDLYLEATQVQEQFFKWPWPLKDWSAEGFAMSTFGLGAILLPALLALVPLFLTKSKTELVSPLAVGVLYFVGLLLLELLHSGGDLHSLHRFVFCSPAFVFIFLYLTDRSPKTLIILGTMGLGTFLFLALGFEYAGNSWRWQFLGAPLWALTFSMPWLLQKTPKLAYSLLLVFSLINIWWNTYLLNQLLANAWIFT